MTQTTAQVLVTTLFLTFALLFVLLDAGPLAAGCVGAIAGQGVSAGVRKAVNGNGNGKH